MKKQLTWLAALLLVIAFVSCGKEEDPPEVKTKTQLLTQSSWKFQSATASGTDISGNASLACIKDDAITFNTNGTGVIAEGAVPVVCSPAIAGNFTWSFQSGETILVMSSGLFPGGSGTFTINSITETSISLSQNVTVSGFPSPVPVTAIYVH